MTNKEVKVEAAESLETAAQEEVEKHPEKMKATYIARRVARSSTIRMAWTTTWKLTQASVHSIVTSAPKYSRVRASTSGTHRSTAARGTAFVTFVAKASIRKAIFQSAWRSTPKSSLSVPHLLH